VGLFGFKSKNKLGVDIGTSSIKVVEMSKESGRFKLENYGLFELESVDEAVNVTGRAAKDKPAQLSDRDLAWGIREVLKRAKISARTAVASIPSFSTFATIISMPYLSEEDVAKTIPFEARKYIPLPLIEVVLDWSIINVAPEKSGSPLQTEQSARTKPPMVEIFLVAVPKEETLRYQAIMKNAGLDLRALELENSALIRALIGNDLSPTAIINIGGRSTSILIVDSGFERVSRNYEVGGFEITKSVASSLGVSLRRAEELKRSFGIKEADNNIIREAMSSLIDMMAFETKKTIHNYEDQKGVKIGKILLVGGLANMPNFANYFGEKLGIPTSLGNSLARVIVPPGLSNLQTELNSTFAIAVGLAMREI
jgi:type IV pilus assembly protein PilM